MPEERTIGGGPLHLVKMAVGVGRSRRAAPDPRRAHGAARRQLGLYPQPAAPRAEAVLDGGSIYWVIRGQIRVRQRVTRLSQRARRQRPSLLPDRGRHRCWCRRCWRPLRPFQGWRYLTPADAPPDAPTARGGDLAGEPPPEAMLRGTARSSGCSDRRRAAVRRNFVHAALDRAVRHRLCWPFARLVAGEAIRARRERGISPPPSGG